MKHRGEFIPDILCYSEYLCDVYLDIHPSEFQAW